MIRCSECGNTFESAKMFSQHFVRKHEGKKLGFRPKHGVQKCAQKLPDGTKCDFSGTAKQLRVHAMLIHPARCIACGEEKHRCVCQPGLERCVVRFG